MDSIKPEIMDQITNPSGHHDRLSSGNPAQGTPIQMIEVSVGDQYQINRRQVVNPNSGPTDPLY
jgi:hypothetical protein